MLHTFFVIWYYSEAGTAAAFSIHDCGTFTKYNIIFNTPGSCTACTTINNVGNLYSNYALFDIGNMVNVLLIKSSTTITIQSGSLYK